MVGMSRVLMRSGQVMNEVVSFFVFSVLDVLDMFLCLVYKMVDLLVEAEWRPCYCSSGMEAITSSGKILVYERGESKVVRLTSTKLQLEDISDTLYTRPSIASAMMDPLRRVRKETVAAVAQRSRSSTLTINSTIVEMLQEKVGGRHCHRSRSPIPRWSDCDCSTCNSWSSSTIDSLFVRTHGPQDNQLGNFDVEDVLFIHGFISSSSFWSETVFPNISEEGSRRYRLIAIDLLGFGRSPKPADSLYTLRDHMDMIKKSVLDPYKVKSFHIVAHSLGCIIALALAVKFSGAVKSITLLAPPYFPVPRGVNASQYVLRKVAPRRVWPPMAMGASMGSWYEHISRTICLVICKNHRVWEFIAKQITRSRMRTFLMEGFFCHTHYAAWHTLHNIICGTASKMEGYMDTLKDQLSCTVTVLHGSSDEVIPAECSLAVKSKIPRANVKLIEKKDHITIVVGREKTFARELEEIWMKASVK